MTMSGFRTIAIMLLAASTWLSAGAARAGEPAANRAATGGTMEALPDPAQIGRGAEAWAQTCERCHNLRDPGEFSDKNWAIIVNHMRVIAPLPGRDAEDIKAFLKASN